MRTGSVFPAPTRGLLSFYLNGRASDNFKGELPAQIDSLVDKLKATGLVRDGDKD